MRWPPGTDRKHRPWPRALLSDPVDPAVVGRLGWARMLAGDAGGAEAAFRVSGPMGWREPYTQIYWIGQGLHRGQAGLSAQRLDALLRQSPQFEGRDRLFAAITATPEGRAALAGQMGGSPAGYRLSSPFLPIFPRRIWPIASTWWGACGPMRSTVRRWGRWSTR
jgi:hypothetical protein